MDYVMSAKEFRTLLESMVTVENKWLRENNSQSPVFQIYDGEKKINVPNEGALMLKADGDLMCPSVSLYRMRKEYHEMLAEKGIAHSVYVAKQFIDDYFRMIEDSHRSLRETQSSISIPFDFEKVRDSIRPCICKTDRNRELLAEVSHREVLDLSIYYRIDVEMPEEMGVAGTVVVSNRMLDGWNWHSNVPITEETLYARAHENERVRSRITDMNDVMGGIIGDILGIPLEKPPYTVPEAEYEKMYIITNESKQYGAVDVFVGIGMEEFIGQKEMDFYILPSSIHEAILVPDTEDLSPKILSGFVAQVNGTEVPEDEKLSDNVYYYDHKTKEVQIAYDADAAKLERSEAEKKEQAPAVSRQSPRHGR